MRDKIYVPFGELEKASFIERPNRFVVRCKLTHSSEIVEAHLADPGRLKELLVPDAPIYVKYVNSPKRKTKWSVVLVRDTESNTLVSVQSTLVNQLAKKALKLQVIPELQEWQFVRAEHSLGNSRWDFLLNNNCGKQRLVEVKSCSLVQNEIAMFPDAVTTRGQKHVKELIRLQKEGDFTSTIVFIIQRSDAKLFRPADHIDLAFGQALREANEQGVLVLAYKSIVNLDGIELGEALPIDLR